MNRVAGSNSDKTSVKFWEGKVYKQKVSGAEGNKTASPYFYANLCHGNKTARVCLQTANKLEAANRARNAYLLLKSQGWEAMWEVYRVRKSREEADRQDAKHRGESVIEEHAKKEGEIETVGEFIERIEKISLVQLHTLEGYIGSFYRILEGIYGINYGNEKHNYIGGKNQERKNRIGKIKISEVTHDKIEEWKNNYLKIRMKENPSKRDSAVATINSTLGGAKNLFSKKNLKALGLASGITNPFVGIEFFEEASHRYVTKFSAKDILQDAQENLKPANKNAYIAFLLGLGAGLRKNEIDKLLWEQVDYSDGFLVIRNTPYIRPKTKESSSDIKLAQFIIKELECHRAETDGIFVLPSKIVPRLNVKYRHYRCQKDFKFLYKWLDERGISEQKRLHTMRKEYGSQICNKHGLYMASRALRHSSYSVTEKHYTDRTALVVPDIF
ncbi:MAG: site-specific integrase [Puniceicoccales bacterium]|jgi:integrase|nr:site-specific integrase [Puniceicoccales bacterium]